MLDGLSKTLFGIVVRRCCLLDETRKKKRKKGLVYFVKKRGWPLLVLRRYRRGRNTYVWCDCSISGVIVARWMEASAEFAEMPLLARGRG